MKQNNAESCKSLHAMRAALSMLLLYYLGFIAVEAKLNLPYIPFLMQILVCSLPKREENIPPIYMLRLLFLVVL